MESAFRKQRYVIYALLFATIIALLIRDFLDGIDIDFWGTLVVYGLLNMLFGASDMFRHLRASREIVGVRVDGPIVIQILLAGVAVSVVLFGQALRSLVTEGVSGIGGAQMLGAVIILTRLTAIIQAQKGLTYGLWSWTVYTLGLALCLLPPAIEYFVPVDGTFLQLLQLVIPVFLAGLVWLSEAGRVRY